MNTDKNLKSQSVCICVNPWFPSSVADNLKKAGWSYGYVSALDRQGRTIWIADAHRRMEALKVFLGLAEDRSRVAA